jgi:hypothetical protein
LVSVLGGLSLASSAAYLVALWAAWRMGPGEEPGGFVETAPLWVFVPFTCTAVYFWARVQAGRVMLERGDVEGAWAWSSARITHDFWRRSRREAQINRVTAARAALALGRVLEARMMLWRAPEDELHDTREWLEHARLRADVCFRQDRGVEEAQAALDQAAEKIYGEAPAARAEWAACAAELACERGEIEEAERLIGEARWGDEVCVRAWWVEARVALEKGWGHERGLEALDAARAELDAAQPGRAAEVAWVRAELLDALGRADGARAERAAARALVEEGRADARARRIVTGLGSDEEE